MRVLEETFVKNFFEDGHNLYACVCVDKNGFYLVQLGHSTVWYKRKDNAFKAYDNYIAKCRGLL